MKWYRYAIEGEEPVEEAVDEAAPVDDVAPASAVRVSPRGGPPKGTKGTNVEKVAPETRPAESKALLDMFRAVGLKPDANEAIKGPITRSPRNIFPMFGEIGEQMAKKPAIPKAFERYFKGHEFVDPKQVDPKQKSASRQ